MTAVPTRLPKIGSPRSHNGKATSPPTTGGTVSASAIQNQFNSFIGNSARTADKPTRVDAHALPADGLLANGTDSYRGRAVMDEAVHVSLALRREANNRLRHQLFGPGDPLRRVW